MARNLIRYNLRRAAALAVETATDDSVSPAGLDSVVPPSAVAKEDTARNQPLQRINGSDGKISHMHQIVQLAISRKLLRHVRRWLVIGLTAAALVPAPLSYAAPVLLTQAAANESSSSSSEPDVKAMAERADELQSKRKYGEAATIWKQILPILEKILGPDHPDVAISLNSLAMLLKYQGQYAAAEPLYRRSLIILEKAFGPDHPDVATILNNLAGLLGDQGHYAAAESLYRRSLAIREKALGPGHPDVATALNNLAVLLQDQKQYAAAEPLFRRSLAIDERVFGSDHPDVAFSLNNLAVLMSDQGQQGAAEPLFRRSLAIREKALGPDHPDVATALNNLAMSMNDQGRYATAEPVFRRSLAIREKALGLDHPDVATALNNLAMSMNDQGRYATAEPLFRRSLAIREKALGLDHPDVATALNSLAGLFQGQGRYATAEPLLRRSLAIGEKALGPDHPNVATALNNLAVLTVKQGRYGAAEAFYRRSLAIREKALGPNHPEVAAALNNLAELLRIQGQYSAAEPLYRRSLKILENALGQDHPDVATALNNLALLLNDQGQYGAAEAFYLRSLAIREKALGPNHPDVATALNNLAVLLQYQRQYPTAENLFRRSLAIYEKAFGPDHPNVATALNNLAGLMRKQGQYGAAEPLDRRSLAIREKALGADHRDVANSLNNLAMLLQTQGQYAAAEPLQRRSLAIYEKALGPDHPNVATTLNNLAGLFISDGQKNNAILAMNHSFAIQLTWLLRELPLLPDQSRSAQLRQLGDTWQWPFGWIDRHPPAAQLALETRLNRQGLLPEIEQRQALLLDAPGVDRAKVEQLQDLTQQLASVSLPRDRRAAVREQRDKLQAEIYRQIPELQLQPVTTAEVAKALPADGALVEFQRYQPFDSRKPKGQRWGEPQYIALVLKPDGSINSIPLGPAAPIDGQVNQALRASANALSDTEVIWAQLSDQILKPLLPQLSGSRQWFLSPDGELNRVPFAALPAPQRPGTPLAQAVQLRLLTTGRELLRLQQPAPAGSTAVVMANPNYDRPGATAAAIRPVTVAMAAQRRSAELGNNHWKPLPGSEQEGQQVANLLGTGLIRGSAATTTALQRQQGPRVLHVATHGFFVADQESKATEALVSIQEDSPLLRSLRQEDPQLRSGLVLAGANQPDLDPNDDGYLTAAEAVTLNLKGTELVVLSACSTGQGDVRTGEGVYGLQRSLTVAGTRSTLLSLWKVDDAATAEFMVRFYQRLKAGEGRSDALATVQQEFRSGKVQGPSGTNWKEPYYWAAWQLVGDWRSIKGL
jgi:CHAT domain-containing protein/Tfp pilus assembly protein PilF